MNIGQLAIALMTFTHYLIGYEKGIGIVTLISNENKSQ